MSNLPEKAPAIVITEFGGPEKLRLEDVAVPRPKPGEVLIRVRATALNRADTVQREGNYPPPPGESEILGLECAGEIAALGDGVDRFNIGDPVCALLPGGGYATYCTAPAVQVLPMPKGFDVNQAAAVPECFATVWTNVFDETRGWLKAGERLLVHGGSSGIGTAAIALANARGAEVYTTAGNAEKCAVCEKLGAKRAINYREEDFVEVMKQETGGEGVDVVFDMVGGDYIPRNLSLLRLEGRHVSVAFLGGTTAEIDLVQMLFKRLRITGSTLRSRTVPQKGEVIAAIHENVWPGLEDGSIPVVIDSVMPLKDAAEAHRRIESSVHIGKIILAVD